MFTAHMWQTELTRQKKNSHANPTRIQRWFYTKICKSKNTIVCLFKQASYQLSLGRVTSCQVTTLRVFYLEQLKDQMQLRYATPSLHTLHLSTCWYLICWRRFSWITRALHTESHSGNHFSFSSCYTSTSLTQNHLLPFSTVTRFAIQHLRT